MYTTYANTKYRVKDPNVEQPKETNIKKSMLMAFY